MKHKQLLLLPFLLLLTFACIAQQAGRGFLDQSTGFGFELGRSERLFAGMGANQFIQLEPLSATGRGVATSFGFFYTARLNFQNVATFSHEAAIELHWQWFLHSVHVGAWGEQMLPFGQKNYFKGGPELGITFFGFLDVSYAQAVVRTQDLRRNSRISIGLIFNGQLLSNGPFRHM